VTRAALDMDARSLKILILGGYGTFGGRKI
jgi:hypothetical protein